MEVSRSSALLAKPVVVEVDIISDGHDIVAAELLWKAADEKDWTVRRCGNWQRSLAG